MTKLSTILGIALLASLGAASAQRDQRKKRVDRAPQEGAPIPQVSATSPDGNLTVKLSEPKRFTVLVFGSYS